MMNDVMPRRVLESAFEIGKVCELKMQDLEVRQHWTETDRQLRDAYLMIQFLANKIEEILPGTN